MSNVRSSSEIIERIKRLDGSPDDYFGFQCEILTGALTFDDARPFLDEEKIAERGGAEKIRAEWKWELPAEGGGGPSGDEIRAEMLNYLSFAWEKATGHRGLSAGRSIDNLLSWVWLLGDDVLLARFLAAPYQNYGAPKLLLLSDELGFDLDEELESRAVESARRMAVGLICRKDGCSEGGCS